MRRLPPPTDSNATPLDPGDVFATCISRVRKKELRDTLRKQRTTVENEAADYDAKAIDARLYQKQAHSSVGGVSGEEMTRVYTNRMARKKAPGYEFYNRIKLAPINAKCPLCGVGTVRSLDHYLPKASFPVLSVVPNNLVPVCDWCQGEKGEYVSTRRGGQLLHPYFDDYDSDSWLAARVVQGVPAAFVFYAAPPEKWPTWKRQRVEAHLRQLDLATLYSSNAGGHLSEIRGSLQRVYDGGGAISVWAYLQDQLTSVQLVHGNSWTSAMYKAAAHSSWFCEGGFLET